MSVREDLVNYVFSKSDLDNIDEIPLNKSLLSEGILDSLGILELCEYIEENWNIKIEDDDFTQDTLGSIEKMTNYVQKKI